MSTSFYSSLYPSSSTTYAFNPIRGVGGLIACSISCIALILVLLAVLVVPLARSRLTMRLVSYLNATSLIWTAINLTTLSAGMAGNPLHDGALCQAAVRFYS